MRTFEQYLREMAATRSISHLLDVAHSDRLMVILSSFRGGVDQPPPRSLKDLEHDIRNQRGYEVVPNPNPFCNTDREIAGPNVIADLPKTGEMGVTKSRGGFKEDEAGEVCEDSLVVSHKRSKNHPSDDEVIQFFLGLCRKYNQEAFIFKSPSTDEVEMVYANGKRENLGAFSSVSMLSPYFTMLRKGPEYNSRRVAALPRPTPADRLGDNYERLR